ncbi:MAG: hypothetical protein AVDCRST_MAG45-567, partial [uncultured Solirubrobacterales bacterium]
GPSRRRRRGHRRGAAFSRLALGSARPRLGQRALRRRLSLGGGLPRRRAARRGHGRLGPRTRAQPRDRPAAVVHGDGARDPPRAVVGGARAAARAESLRGAARVHARDRALRASRPRRARGGAGAGGARLPAERTRPSGRAARGAPRRPRDRRARRPRDGGSQPEPGLDLGLALAGAPARLDAARGSRRPGERRGPRDEPPSAGRLAGAVLARSVAVLLRSRRRSLRGAPARGPLRGRGGDARRPRPSAVGDSGLRAGSGGGRRPWRL